MTWNNGTRVRIKSKSALYDEAKKDVIGVQVGEAIGSSKSRAGYSIIVHWSGCTVPDDKYISTKHLQVVPVDRDRADRVDTRNGAQNDGTGTRQRRKKEKKKDINLDAADYQARINKSMVFYACCVCTYETGLENLSRKEKYQELINASAMPGLYARMVAPCTDDNCSPSDVSYAIAARNELLEDGTVKNCSYLCKKCQTQLKSTPGSDSLPCPKNALVNGHFKGSCPEELKNLNLTEMSLISLITVVTKVSLLGNLNYGSGGTMFTIVNDLSVLVPSLPQRPTIEDFAFISSAGNSETRKKHRYSPWKVLRALRWLEVNNPLYVGKVEVPAGEDFWTDVDADMPMDVIEVDEESFVGVDGLDVAADTDGHAVNPSATPSDCTDVLLMPSPDTADIVDQVRTILTEGNCQIPPVFNRTTGETVSMQSTDYFIEKAFPHLYPYGRGGPGAPGKTFDASYIKLVLSLGIGREFQQFPTFIFYCYRWIMHKAAGSIGWLTERKVDADNDDQPALTVDMAVAFLNHAQGKAPAEAQMVSRAEISMLLNRIIPYGDVAMGTEAFFKLKKSQLLATISSPVTTSEGFWSQFMTEAFNDSYSAEMFDNAITSANPIHTEHGTHHSASLEERIEGSNRLTWSERTQILRDHPCLAARMHSLQLDALFTTIIKGRCEPFGEVLDHWIRIEFQNKGTAHSHWLLNTRRHESDTNTAADIDVQDPEVAARVIDLCHRTCTARLQPRHADDTSDLSPDPAEHEQQRIEESQFTYNISRKQYFTDDWECHPCRQRFRADVDYSYDPVTGICEDPYVRKQVRRLQLHNNMHICRASCFKYCPPGVRICRYNFPREPLENNEEVPVIISDRDKRKRVCHKVHPCRNCANLNNCPVNPLIYCSQRGNMDAQVLLNSGGCVEYTCKYCGKADTAESTALQNTISRELSNHVLKLAPHESTRFGKRIRAVINAVVQGQQIGAVHACYILLKLKLVLSSRLVENVNALTRELISSQPIVIDEELLQQMDGDESALSNSPRSTFGRRDAYHALFLAQKIKYDSVTFDFFSFMSSYTVEKMSPTEKHPKKASDIPQLVMDANGLMKNATTCCIYPVLYRARKKHAVLKLTPHIPATEDSERGAYSILLLHSDWGTAGESGLLADCENAIVRLDQLREAGCLPEYVKRNLGRRTVSEAHLNNTGEPAEAPTAVTEADFDDYATEAFEAAEENENEEAIYIPPADGLPEVSMATNTWMTNTPPTKMAYLGNWINNLKAKTQASNTHSKSLTTVQALARKLDPTLHFAIENADAEQDMLDKLIETCNVAQADVVKTAEPYLTSAGSGQMIMLLSGEGGTGKSHIINILTTMTQICHGKQEGRFGSVCKAAPTGGAAYNIGGMTWQSATGKCNFKAFKMSTKLTSNTINRLRKDFKGCKFFIIDEISLLSLEDINEINCRLQLAMDNKLPFGGLHVLLAGDYYQMRTMSGKPVFTATENWNRNQKYGFSNAAAGRDIFTKHLTHFKMLTQNVRAQATGGEPSPLALCVAKIRIGDTSGTVLETINQQCTQGHAHAMHVAHPLAVWICPTHAKIAVVNKNHAAKLTRNGGKQVRLIANHVAKNASIQAPNAEMRNKLYSVAGDIKGSIKNQPLSHIDLQIGTRVRITKNLSVQNGLFNGAMGTIHGFVYKGKGPDPDKLMPSNFANLEYEDRELPILLVRMDGIDDTADPSKSTFQHSCSLDTSRLIPIAAEPCTMKIKNNYHRVMYPLLVAHARTAHSLQGFTALHGAVIDTGSMFFAGDYVAISRAKSLDQVWLLSPLLSQHVTSHPEYRVLIEKEYARLLRAFPSTI